jgi:uncharacterized membrane protein YebE (DUF533 family)
LHSLAAALKEYAASGQFPDNPLSEPKPGVQMSQALNPAAAPSRAAAAPNETQSRFASPNEAARLINGPRTDAMVADQARRWLDSVDTQTAVEQFVAQAVPLPLDAAEHAAAVLMSKERALGWLAAVLAANH